MSRFSDPLGPTILARLMPAQADDASRDRAVLALTGTGKTRTLTAAVAWRVGVLGDQKARL